MEWRILFVTKDYSNCIKLFAPTYGNTLRLNDKTTSFETVWRAFVIGMPTKQMDSICANLDLDDTESHGTDPKLHIRPSVVIILTAQNQN